MPDLTPVQLHEDEETGDRFLIYGDESGARVELNYRGDRLWMTQAQIAELFGRDRSTITKHISNVLAEGELDEESNVQKMHIATATKPITLYSLDMVISVGYRVSSKQATLFRRWATDKLVQFATTGFVVDVVRLKDPDNRDRIAELKEIVRDIRSDEANVYRELRRICTMCQDYDGKSKVWREFYQKTQAKIVYAVCSKTPSELLIDRANAAAEDMGLTHWPNANIRKADVSTSKNYLASGEIKELNRLTIILLDIFEDQMEIGRLKLMSEASKLLDDQLKSLGRVVLDHGGSVKTKEAKLHAERQYTKYSEQQKALRHQQADEAIAAIKRTIKPSKS